MVRWLKGKVTLPGSLQPELSTRKMPLLQLSSLRFLWQHPWQTWLTFIGILLGVSMIVAVDLANSSARRAFSLSLETVAGPVTHQVVGGPTGIPESVYVRMRTELGIRTSAPMVMGRVFIEKQQFTLLGIDPFAEDMIGRHLLSAGDRAMSEHLLRDQVVMLTEGVAKSLELELNEEFVLTAVGRPHQVILGATFPTSNAAASAGLVFADIAVAQELFGRYGYLDRIELMIDEKQADLIRDWLPPGLSLEESQVRNDSLQEMTDAFHINLTAMSLLAMLVAALLIYNTVTLSVLQRRNTLGIYRSIGVSRNEIFGLILTETLSLAILASLAGLVIGLFLGHYLVQLVTRTVNDLYFAMHVKAFLLDPASMLKGFIMGVGMSVLSALLPALGAARSQPVSLQQRSSLEQGWQTHMPKLLALGVALMLAGFLLVSKQYGSLVEGFIALTLIVLGFCLTVPSIVLYSTRFLALIVKPINNSSLRMAVRGINAGISRTGMAIAALTVAVSVTVGVGIMVSSFRETVQLWLQESLVGDIYVAPLDGYPLERQIELREQLLGLDEVDGVMERKFASVETENGPVRLMAFTSAPNDAGLPIKQAIDNAAEMFHRGEGVFISEPLAFHTRLEPGNEIRIRTNQGMQGFPVLGVYYNYASSRGVISMQRSDYTRRWNDETYSSVTVYRSATADLDTTLASVASLINKFEGNAFVSSNGEILQEAMAVFDRTFAITRVLRLLAVLVAFVGVLSALMALQLERIKEYAILRATGMTPVQVGAMILMQTAIIGLISGLLSLPLGFMMADILIEVINRRAFGWSMQHFVPPDVLLQALILAFVAAIVAGIYPAFRAATISAARALREE
jgi:putative ABC transport system permease protein